MSRSTKITTSNSDTTADHSAYADIVNDPTGFWANNESLATGIKFFSVDERNAFVQWEQVLLVTAVQFEPYHTFNNAPQPRWIITAMVNDDLGRISFTDNEHRGNVFRAMAEWLQMNSGASIPVVMQELPPQQKGHQPYRFLMPPNSFKPSNSANSDN